MQDDEDFLKVRRFKWSFNIKPDIVIHLDKVHAVSIEAKYESSEGSDPSAAIEKTIFNEREIPCGGQMEFQRYLMVELLGAKTDFMFLVFKNKESVTHRVVSWAEAIEASDFGDMLPFAIKIAKKITA